MLEDFRGNRGRKVVFTVRRGLDRGHELAAHGSFEDAAGGTCLDDLVKVQLVLMHGENDDMYLREAPADLGSGFKAVEIGHGNVHDNHMRLEAFDHVKRLAAIPCLTNH